MGWLGAIAALLGRGARSPAHGAPAPDRHRSLDDEAPASQGAQAALDAAALTALAAAVLPGELGADGARKAARDFARYAAAYRANAEVLHPYGSPRLSVTGASPLPQWRGQLDALQREVTSQPSSTPRYTAAGPPRPKTVKPARL